MNAENTRVWTPRVTVAAVIEQAQRFLLVREYDGARHVYNQPAGHLEEGESLLQAVIRETREETRRHFQPQALVGVYRIAEPESGITYLRFAFSGSCSEPDPAVQRDCDILGEDWLTPQQLATPAYPPRSPLVERTLADYLAGQRFPLDLLTDMGWQT